MCFPTPHNSVRSTARWLHLRHRWVNDTVANCMSTRPNKPIRRLDIFAEYRKQDEQASGMRADEAKGYGLWVAKVVAARKFGRMRERGTTPVEDRNRRRRKWHV